MHIRLHACAQYSSCIRRVTPINAYQIMHLLTVQQLHRMDDDYLRAAAFHRAQLKSVRDTKPSMNQTFSYTQLFYVSGKE